jgi:hypothetical protein
MQYISFVVDADDTGNSYETVVHKRQSLPLLHRRPPPVSLSCVNCIPTIAVPHIVPRAYACTENTASITLFFGPIFLLSILKHRLKFSAPKIAAQLASPQGCPWSSSVTDLHRTCIFQQYIQSLTASPCPGLHEQEEKARLIVFGPGRIPHTDSCTCCRLHRSM